jgi:hypothetical protein
LSLSRKPAPDEQRGGEVHEGEGVLRFLLPPG